MKYVIAFMCFLSGLSLEAQNFVIRSKADFRINYGVNGLTGDRVISSGNFRLPALFSNFKQSTSGEILMGYQVMKKLNVGVWIANSSFSNWEQGSATTYTDSKATIFSYGAALKYRSNVGLTNSFKNLFYFVSLCPGIYQIGIKTDALSSINDNGLKSSPLESNASKFGLGIRIGFDFDLTSSLGISTSSGYQAVFGKSIIYPENRIGFVDYRVGLYFRLIKDKKYRYSTL